MQNLERIAVPVRLLAPGDSLGKAAEAVQASGVGAAPVAEDGRLIGLVTEDLLADCLAEELSFGGDTLQVRDLLLERVLALPSTIAPREALWFLEANDAEAAPVIDPAGGLVGMVSRAQLVSAALGRVKPPRIGGMATPFGVYLTGGGVRGGVGDLALMSTGIYMAVLNLAAVWIADRMLMPGGWIYALPEVGRWLQQTTDLRMLFTVGWVFLFGLMFRLSWITGFHAAEHQVVHALEAGDDLRPDVVRRKPRVHPRCGTNLVAAVSIMSFFWNYRAVPELQPLLAMVVTFVFWRRVGGWLQQHVTTRPATDGQLESGIHAGRQLIERYQERGEHPGWRRQIWNMGLLQVFAGWSIVIGVVALLQWTGLPLPESLKVFP